MLYRKRPVVIEAFQLGVDMLPEWFTDAVSDGVVIMHDICHPDKSTAEIKTLEGWHHANNKDYIIQGVKGELYPCKPDIFEMTYEEM